jgi:hypothetical protein
LAVAAVDSDDAMAKQQGQRGEYNNQIKAMAVKMAFDSSGIGSEDGI